MLNQKLKNEVEKLIINLKIKKNDNLLIHSNSAGIFQFDNNLNSIDYFYSELKKKIGKSGNIVFPFYNYTVLKKKHFNNSKLKCEVGFLPNYLKKKYKLKRTINPVFSHLIDGPLSLNLEKYEKYSAFGGTNNFFSKILTNNFKIIGFCCPVNSITILHYLEYLNKAPYRFNKKFKLFEIKNKKHCHFHYDYFVGKRKINYSLNENKIRNLLIQKKKINFHKFGFFECWIINAIILEKIFSEKFTKNNYYFINDTRFKK